MKQKSPSRLLATLGLTCALFTASFAGNGYAAPKSDRSEYPKVYFGTSDSGGGTGLANKIFESYAVDPMTLPATRKIVWPLLMNIKGNETESTPFLAFGLQKTWYIAPVELETLDRESLGVSFMKGERQQIARQSLTEIWINKNIWSNKDAAKRMTLKDQGETIVHEMLMANYMTRFLSYSELCKQGWLIVESGCESPILAYRPALEAKRPLNAQDNENIRYATAWFLRELQKPTPAAKVFAMLKSRGFDERFLEDQSTQQTSVKLSTDQFVEFLTAGKHTGDNPSICQRASDGRSKPCRIEFIRESNALGAPVIMLHIEAEGEPTIKEPLVTTENPELFQLQYGTNDYQHILMQWPNMFEGTKIGDRSRLVLLNFVRAGGGLTEGSEVYSLDTIVLKPQVVVSVVKKKGENGEKDSAVCASQSLKPVRFFDDKIIVRREGAKPKAIEKSLLDLPPVSLCAPAYKAN